ncbi:YceD family protein [Pelagimonas varians]|uniref:50S ribosomal protein L34 n=1 Tax=Pelagimonas varians TaxID=696760 RepID=A0A238K7T2_9RHOB|nr:DUF177 domain-containing protein [Pelagimonas varians]PYG31646.1 uncharacterized metal-binding protein YceD (DUF177 family) [Pelagimonas varians]SMX38863.1 hypothetical protein PEV8663_01580 [Pelagimonas varians]
MSAKHPTAPQMPVAELRNSGPTQFLLEPNAGVREALAKELDAQSLKKVRFIGEIIPQGRNGWKLLGKLGATAVQTCIVTLEPVTTRIDTEVKRSFVPAHKIKAATTDSEIELTDEDDETEELGDTIDVAAILAEALSLALPSYPRKDGAETQNAQFSADGVTPMKDDDIRPFAGLAALREKMQSEDKES